MKLNKKRIVFLIVFLLLIISIIYRLLNPFVQPRTDTLTFTGEKNTKINTVAHSIDKDLKTETPVSTFLNKPRISGKVYKDLFSTYRPPQRIADKKEVIVPVATDSNKNPLSEAKEYLASYTFYGTFESEGIRSVFLAKDKMVLVARTGDRLDGKYLIEEIQENHIRIKALDLNETIQLDIGEFNDE